MSLVDEPSASELAADADAEAVVLASLSRGCGGRSEAVCSPNLLSDPRSGVVEPDTWRERGALLSLVVVAAVERSVVDELALPDRDKAARSATVTVEMLLWLDLVYVADGGLIDAIGVLSVTLGGDTDAMEGSFLGLWEWA